MVNNGKRVAIMQSDYIPWRAYFDLMNMVDEFILFDNAQYTRRDWRNRNLIKSVNGPKWLTIPVEVKGKYYQEIKDTVVSDRAWNRQHWKTIVHCYSKAKHFSLYRDLFEELYQNTDEVYLSRINYRFLNAICRLLGIAAKITWSMDYELLEGKNEQLIGLCSQAGANEYVSAPAAKAYMNEELFNSQGIAVSYIDYSGYPEYRQLYPPFDPHVSIIDLIFNEGPEAIKYMRSFEAESSAFS